MSVFKLGNFSDPLLDRQIRDICFALSPAKKGATTARPKLTASDVGRMYFDTTLNANGKPIWWTGAVWVDSAGANV